MCLIWLLGNGNAQVCGDSVLFGTRQKTEAKKNADEMFVTVKNMNRGVRKDSVNSKTECQAIPEFKDTPVA